MSNCLDLLDAPERQAFKKEAALLPEAKRKAFYADKANGALAALRQHEQAILSEARGEHLKANPPNAPGPDKLTDGQRQTAKLQAIYDGNPAGIRTLLDSKYSHATEIKTTAGDTTKTEYKLADEGSEPREGEFYKGKAEVKFLKAVVADFDGDMGKVRDAIKWPLNKQPIETKELATNSESGSNKNLPKIEDFGEKIGGARKDVAFYAPDGMPTGKKAKMPKASDRPAWARRFSVVQNQIDINGRTGNWMLYDTQKKNAYGKPRLISDNFDTEQAALDAIPLAALSLKHKPYKTGEGQYEIWREVNDRKRVKVVDKVFPSLQEAADYMASHAVEIIETNTTFGEADLPKPENTKRTGIERRQGDVDGKDFINTFGFRGVEFGNWNNQADRKDLLNDAYDGLLDLAEVLGLPPNALSLNGDLALAFGARGKGLSSARANYETDKAVINLTKENGAGSLAHEFFHALDHYFGRQDGKASSQWDVALDGTKTLKTNGAGDFVSHGFRSRNSGVREELRDAYKALMEIMFSKAENYVEDTQKADKFVGITKEELAKQLDALRAELSRQKDATYYKRHNKPASAGQLAEFDTVVKQVLDGQSLASAWQYDNPNAPVRNTHNLLKGRLTNDALEKLSELYKAVRGRSGFTTDKNGLLDDLRRAMSRYDERLRMLSDAKSSTEKVKKVPTSFAMDAKSLDQGRGGDYWTTPHEMAARAFQGYVEDSVKAQGGYSPFLNYAPENSGMLTPWGVKFPYPRGEERKAINKAFDQFVKALKTKDGTTGNKILYSKRKPAFYSQLARAIEQLPAKLDNTSGNNIKLWLQANSDKLQVKKDELQWSGVLDWLDLQGKAKVGKADIQAYLQQGGVKIQETTLGDGDTKYQQYTVPGGKDGTYKEFLLTLPVKPDNAPLFKNWLKENGYSFDDPGLRSQYLAEYQREHPPKSENQYQSSHWDQPNVLVHVRFDERQDADGNKVLFMHELQSDWGQQGKKEGFKINLNDRIDRLNDLKKQNETLYKKMTDAVKSGDDDLFEKYQAERDPIIKEIVELEQRGSRNAIPSAPFVTDTKAWVALALKRMAMYAAEHGFDKVAWATGEQSADLYDLRKQVNSIEAVRKDNGKYHLIANLTNGNIQDFPDVKETELENYVGKDLARQIAEQPEGDHEYKGDDLKTGGEGMKAFYNQIVQQVANDVLKRIGGGRVENINFGGNTKVEKTENGAGWLIHTQNGIETVGAGYGDSPDEVYKNWYGDNAPKSIQQGFTLTPAIRDKIQTEGLPLFSERKQGQKSGLSVADVLKLIPKGLKNLISAKKLQVVQNIGAVPDSLQSVEMEGVEGFYDKANDQLYLIADNITKDNLASVLTHELLHRALNTDRKLAFAVGLYKEDMQNRFNLASIGKASPIENAAHARVMAAQTETEHQLEEFQAYLISEYEKNPASLTGKIRKIIQDFISAIRAALFRAGYLYPKELTPQLLSALAKQAGTQINVKGTLNKGRNTLNKVLQSKQQAEHERQYAEIEARYFNPDGSEKPGAMLAPNGEKSKLNKTQWIQVRTQAFKDWFGDWEALAEMDHQQGRGKKAVETLLKQGHGELVGMFRPVLGNIIFDYGQPGKMGAKNRLKDGFGLSHLIEQRKLEGLDGEKIAKAMPEVIAKGLVTAVQGYGTNGERVRITHEGMTAVLSLYRQGEKQTWLLTGWENKGGDGAEGVNPSRTYAGDDHGISRHQVAPSEYIFNLNKHIVNTDAVSKVTDENGEPLALFHGSKANIESFRSDRVGLNYGFRFADGFYFTESKKMASDFSILNGTDGSNVTPVFLRMANPLVVSSRPEYLGFIKKLKESGGVVERDNKLGKKDSELLRNANFDGVIDRENSIMAEVVAFNPTQIKSATGNTGAFSRSNDDIRYSKHALSNAEGAIPSKITDVKDPKQQAQWLKAVAERAAINKNDDLTYKFQDRMVDLKRQVERVGDGLQENINPYLSEELYSQRAASRVDEFYDKEFSPIMKALYKAKVGFDDFQTFLHARHAVSRNKVMAERNPSQAIIDEALTTAQERLAKAQADLDKAVEKNDEKAIMAAKRELAAAKKERATWNRAQPFKGTETERLALSGMADDQAAGILAGIPAHQRALLDKLGNQIDAINNKTLDLLVDYGMETPETIKALKEQWQHYIPLHRDEAHPDPSTGSGQAGNFGHPVGSGYSIKGSGLNKATGSNAEVTNILAHIAAAREQMVKRGEKNKVTVTLAHFINAHPDPAFAELGKLPTITTTVNGFTETLPDPNYKRLDNVVMMRVQGRDIAINFNQKNPNSVRLAASLKNLDGVQLDGFESFVSKGTRWLSSVNTQYNVVFGIMNFMRDVQGSLLNLTTTEIKGKQGQVFKALPGAMKMIFASTRNTRGGIKDSTDPLYDRFLKAGGTTGYIQMFDNITARDKDIRKDFANLGAGKTKKAGMWLLQAIKDHNNLMENATRLAVFKVAVESGLSDAKAASIAKNISVNFNRKGAATTKIGAYYGFFNAAVQGNARLYQTLKGDKGKQIILGGIGLGAAMTMLAMASMGDDEWDEIPDFVKDRSLIVPTSKTTYIAIPMPLGFNVLPNIGRFMAESLFGNPRKGLTERTTNLALSLFDAANPLGGGSAGNIITPSLLDPALDLYKNEDYFGKPIYNEDFSRLNPKPGFKRARANTPEAYKLASEAINKATGGTDYRPGGFNWTPEQIQYVANAITGGTGRELGKLETTVESTVTGADLPLNKIPLVGRLIGDTESNHGSLNVFYDNLRQMNEYRNEIKGLKEERKYRELSEFMREHPQARMVERVRDAKKIIDKLRDRKEALELSGKETKGIDNLINAKAKAVNLLLR